MKVDSVRVNCEPLNLDREYNLGSHNFHACGGDGFACLKDCEYVIKPDDGFANQKLVLEMLDPKTEKAIKYK